MTPSPDRLPRSFFARDPVPLARALLGQRMVSRVDGVRTAGIIVETEAYLGIPDKAAHTYDGRRTDRNEAMWGTPGHAYVYFVYGMHHCVNVVAGREDDPVAVLVRALEPVEGLESMAARRTRARRDTDVCSGPGKLTQALGITRELDGEDLVEGDLLFLERERKGPLADERIDVGPRVGIAYAEEWRDEPLRFSVRDNPHVSRG